MRWGDEEEVDKHVEAATRRGLSGVGPFIGGSVAAVKVRCGNPNCRCASGERHEATILCKKVAGKSTSLHVPLDLVEEVRGWARENKRLKRLVKEISDLGERMIRLHVRTSRAAAENKALVAGLCFPGFNKALAAVEDPRRDHPSKRYPVSFCFGWPC